MLVFRVLFLHCFALPMVLSSSRPLTHSAVFNHTDGTIVIKATTTKLKAQGAAPVVTGKLQNFQTLTFLNFVLDCFQSGSILTRLFF